MNLFSNIFQTLPTIPLSNDWLIVSTISNRYHNVWYVHKYAGLKLDPTPFTHKVFMISYNRYQSYLLRPKVTHRCDGNPLTWPNIDPTRAVMFCKNKLDQSTTRRHLKSLRSLSDPINPYTSPFKVMAKVKLDGHWVLQFMFILFVYFSFCDNQTIFGWDIANSKFDLENS